MFKPLHLIKHYPLVAAVILCIAVGGVLALAGVEIAVRIVLSGFSLIVAGKLGLEMVRTLRKGRYGVDILAIAAIVSTVAVGEYWASIIIVLMLAGGEALEDYAGHRARRELNALLQRAPQTAHKIDGNSTKTISLAKVKVGDELLVKPGEVVPVDAVLLEQAAEFDESSLTGESLPIEHKKGEQLLSGSINGSDAVTIKAIKTARESQYQQIIELVKSASSTEAPFVRLADRYAVPFTVISFLIAGIAWALSGDPVRLAEVLVVATPCPLLLGAPIAMVSGMSRAARNGIIIKSGGILERLAGVRSVAFDKTGTLTRGEPVVSAITPQSGFREEDVLLYAASVEQQSAHVLAQAVVAKSKKEKLHVETPTELHELTAHGLRAIVSNKRVLVGKRSFLVESGITIPAESLAIGETAVYVAVDGVFAGTIAFRDILRREGKKVLKDLKTIGIHDTLMLTGDTKATADRIAKEIGITNVQAECLPVDKVEVIRNVKTRPVMMVGDGVNDALVLAVADVGMAMGARGSTAASETADVVVLVDDLSKTYQAIKIAKNTIKIALQSVWIGIAISVVLMLVATTGAIPAIVGAGLQEVVDVLVIFNALRAHGSWRRG